VAFSGFQLSALAEFADLYDEQVPGLAAQLEAAEFVKRENTGNGFFTDLNVDRSIAPVRCRSPIGGPMAKPGGIIKGIELLLFLKDGYVHLLEGYSVAGEDTSSIDFATLPALPMSLPPFVPTPHP